ncbi:protein DSE2-like [Megalops cyprinoides]|uniref:protein DSE2-like n=1 Tax=Megalops cyprinoides TaxID=118141 RepID=UPI00186425EB|nr:protein DSE2-like [Megalops cyprinoides]
MGGTDVEVQLVFNETSSEPQPSNEDVVQTLVSAVSNTTMMNEFNLTIDASSIRVIINTSTANLTTAAAAASTTAVITTSTVKPATAAPTTTPATSTTSTAAPTSIVQIEFTSRETFVPELSNQSSEAFKARSKLTKEGIEPIYSSAFSNFIRLIVQSFRQGSIITQADLAFNSTVALPSNDQIVSVLRNAVVNSQIPFDIDPNSIKVTSAAPSGVSSLTSVLTASSLAVMSLLLSSCW